MIWNFLADDAATSAAATEAASNGSFFGSYGTWIMLGAVVLLMVVYFIFSSRRRKKQEAEIDDMMSNLVPGDKILTIGRWHGEIVEVLEDGMFVVKTGSDEHPGYVTIEKAAIAHIFKNKPEDVETVETELPPAENGDGVFEENAAETTETESATESATEEVPALEETATETTTELPTLGPSDKNE